MTPTIISTHGVNTPPKVPNRVRAWETNLPIANTVLEGRSAYQIASDGGLGDFAFLTGKYALNLPATEKPLCWAPLCNFRCMPLNESPGHRRLTAAVHGPAAYRPGHAAHPAAAARQCQWPVRFHDRGQRLLLFPGFYRRLYRYTRHYFQGGPHPQFRSADRAHDQCHSLPGYAGRLAVSAGFAFCYRGGDFRPVYRDRELAQ